MRALCDFPDCGRPRHSRGHCITHARHRDAGKPLAPIAGNVTNQGPCTAPGCDRKAKLKRLCDAHYRQQVRGKPLAPIHQRATRPACSFPDCGRKVNAYGLCEAHRNQQKKGQELRPIRVNRSGCDVPGCDGVHRGRGLCVKHYAQQYPSRPRVGRAPVEPKRRAPKRKRKREAVGDLPAGWFEPSLKKPSNPAGAQKLTADHVGMPVGVTDGMRRHALTVTASKARSRDELERFLSMIFDIEPQKENAA